MVRFDGVLYCTAVIDISFSKSSSMLFQSTAETLFGLTDVGHVTILARNFVNNISLLI